MFVLMELMSTILYLRYKVGQTTIHFALLAMERSAMSVFGAKK
jgi:hypothetical protein